MSLTAKPVFNLKRLQTALPISKWLYGSNISSYGDARLRRFVKRMVAAQGTAGTSFFDDPQTTTADDGLGYFKINDGSLPFGGKFHTSHTGGQQIDIAHFGNRYLESFGVDYVTEKGKQRLLDLKMVVEYRATLKDPSNPTLQMPTDWECSLQEKLAIPDCKAVWTVEKCLYNFDPVQSETPQAARAVACQSSLPVPSIALRNLEFWLSSNRAGLLKAKELDPKVSFFTTGGETWYSSIKLNSESQRLIKVGYDNGGKSWNREILRNARLPNGVTLYKCMNHSPMADCAQMNRSVGLPEIYKEDVDKLHYDHHHVRGFSK